MNTTQTTNTIPTWLAAVTADYGPCDLVSAESVRLDPRCGDLAIGEDFVAVPAHSQAGYFSGLDYTARCWIVRNDHAGYIVYRAAGEGTERVYDVLDAHMGREPQSDLDDEADED